MRSVQLFVKQLIANPVPFDYLSIVNNRYETIVCTAHNPEKKVFLLLDHAMTHNDVAGIRMYLVDTKFKQIRVLELTTASDVMWPLRRMKQSKFWRYPSAIEKPESS